MAKKVKFYLENDGNVFAFFPETFADQLGNYLSYSHIGQHSACSKEYLKGKKLASPEQYNDLYAELIGQGYDDLQIIDSRKAISKILHPVNSKYGAPMGRLSVGNGKENATGKVFDSPVPLYDGYDKGGAYWGYPSNLRVKYTADLSYIEFYRK
jgi:hypothetical protein